ncbi:uncharacterized protein LOC122375318 [Amphibalanus amphitrite]|uniref:uncharacterized protein LOC122375318 n=1 Tax=Amphibalanus amphitrite TaxID=1232801 RepID=UPI001C91FCB7|nr:uncharacterized protein LOC122375318 [Amphibalanus amphitrite]
MEESDDSLSEFQSETTPAQFRVGSNGQDGEVQPSAKKHRGQGIAWKTIWIDLADQQAALAMMNSGQESDAGWRLCRTHKTSEGDKAYYVCRNAACKRQMMVLYHSNKTTVSVLSNGVEHSHLEVQDHLEASAASGGAGHGLKPSVKKAVDFLFQSGIQKPLAVQRSLRDQGIEASQKKLANYLRTLKKNKYGKPTMNYAELREWCESHSEVPDDEDEPYVIDWASSADRGHFRVQFTTRKLLRLAAKSDVVHVDATYKLNWNGCPVLITGVTDRQGKFFPSLYSVTSTETTEDYAALLLCLKESVERETNEVFRPRVVVADCCEAISNAVEAVFPQAIRRSCWFHVKKAVDSRLRGAPEAIRKIFLQDLANLQVCLTAAEFRWFGARMLEKWRRQWPTEDGERFCRYFSTTYLQRFSVWSEGHDVASPSTNNGLEAFNGEIKKQHTMRERLPVGQFLVLSLTMVRHWSRDCGTRRVFSESLAISLDLHTRGFQWTNSGKSLVSEEDGLKKIYIPAGSDTQITQEDLDNFKDVVEGGVDRCESFDVYTRYRFRVWVVTDEGDGSDVWKLRCTCPVYLKGNICKHVVGVAYFRDMLSVPEAAKTVPIGQNRKRGRPAKAKPALQRQ